ncbi:hypothetical protein AB0M45_33750, partial [Nocardia sp. NPDC051787]|uniref:hypothetical protein n=1 Tax=Nocardia sp. NPDC051787 TaxID=3155415 RepID=UPI00343BD62E
TPTARQARHPPDGQHPTGPAQTAGESTPFEGLPGIHLPGEKKFTRPLMELCSLALSKVTG